MDTNRKSKWQVRLAVVLIFVLGFAAGALALNTYQKWSRSRAQVTRQQRFEQMLDRLQLSSEQKTAGPTNTQRDSRTATSTSQRIGTTLRGNSPAGG